MKTVHFKFMLALTGAAMLLATACSDKENNGLDNGDASLAAVSNITYTGCKGHTDRAAKADPMWGDPDSVSVNYANGTVYITHYNLLVNCGFGANGILVDVNVDGSTITIREHEDPSGPQANCMCATDNSFQLDNVPHGTYTLVFTNWYPEPYSQTYTF